MWRKCVYLTLVGLCLSCSMPSNKETSQLDLQAERISKLNDEFVNLQKSMQQTSDLLQKRQRFQIVNGTPELSRNIMLLDTENGRVWILCDGSVAPSLLTDSAWCAMNFIGSRKSQIEETGNPYEGLTNKQ